MKEKVSGKVTRGWLRRKRFQEKLPEGGYEGKGFRKSVTRGWL